MESDYLEFKVVKFNTKRLVIQLFELWLKNYYDNM